MAEAAEPEGGRMLGDHRLPAWCALVVFAVTLAVSPWPAWSAGTSGWALFSADGGWPGRNEQLVAVALSVPTALAVLAVLAFRSSRATRWSAPPAALGTAAVLLAAVRMHGYVPPGAGMGLALMAYPGLLITAIVAGLVFRTGAAPRPRLIVAAVLTVALTAGVTYGTRWYAGLSVDSVTASASAPARPSGPPGRLLWSESVSHRGAELDLPGTEGIALAGGLVAVTNRHGQGIEVRDAAGAPRWHYARSDLQFGGMGASTDGRTAVAVYAAKHPMHGWWLAGLDAATGAIRWQHIVRGNRLDLRGAPTAVGNGGDPITVYNPRTGTRLWTRSFGSACPGRESDDDAVVGTDLFTAAVVPCLNPTPGQSRADVQAIDASGRVRWTAPPSAVSRAPLSGVPPQLLAAGPDGVLVEWVFRSRGPGGASYRGERALLDPATGRPRWSTGDTSERYLGVGDHVMLFAAAERGGIGRLRLRDAATGARRAAQPPPDAVPAGWRVSGSDQPAATRGGRGYVTVVRHNQVRLLVLELASGRLLGSYPVPSSARQPDPKVDLKATVRPGDGIATVTVDGDEQRSIDIIRSPG